jgi:hypothetical protein
MRSVKANVIPVITGANWNHFKITQKVPERRTGKARNYGTAKTQPFLGAAHKLRGSADMTVQNVLHGGNNITCSTDCKLGTAATVCTLETWFVSGTLL